VAACLAIVAWVGHMSRRSLTQQVAALAASESAAQSAAAAASDNAGALEKVLADARSKSDQLNGELTGLKQAHAVARMEIASLRATVRRFDEGIALIVWDAEKQEGKLKLEKMPPVQANKDYQLWVIDRKNPTPVSAGVVKVDSRGVASVSFKPVEPVSGAPKFAISIEAFGGVPKKSADGPIVFSGP
jgi:anti-sigma-K factor RskA